MTALNDEVLAVAMTELLSLELCSTMSVELTRRFEEQRRLDELCSDRAEVCSDRAEVWHSVESIAHLAHLPNSL